MSRLRSPLVVLFLLSTLANWPLEAAEPLAAPPPTMEQIRQSMQDRNYPEAIKAIDEAIRAKAGSPDYLAYLKGWALCLAKQFDPAIAAFEQVEKQHPKSPWLRRARFAKAVAMARKGDFRSAELVYRAEAGVLLSSERKQELAGIYLAFADGYFQPPKPDAKPDYQLAMEFYQKALEVGVQPEKRAAVELRVAECALAKRPSDQRWSTVQQEVVNTEYLMGLEKYQAKRYDEAIRLWSDFLARYPLDNRSAEILVRFGRMQYDQKKWDAAIANPRWPAQG